MNNTLPLSKRCLRGAIGNRFVIRHYDHGIVYSKFPDMSAITPSAGQATCRNSFKEAVQLATADYHDPTRRELWKQKLNTTTRLFGAIVKHYMLLFNQAPQLTIL